MVFNYCYCYWLFVLHNHWPVVYIVMHCCFGRYLSFVSGLFLLFHFFPRTSFISLCAPWQVVLFVVVVVFTLNRSHFLFHSYELYFTVQSFCAPRHVVVVVVFTLKRSHLFTRTLFISLFNHLAHLGTLLSLSSH